MFADFFVGGILILLGICVILLMYFGRRAVRIKGLLTVDGTVTEVHGDGGYTVEYTAENHVYTKKYGGGFNPQMFSGNQPKPGLAVQVTVMQNAPGQILSVHFQQSRGRFADSSQRKNTRRLIWLSVLLVAAGIYEILNGLGVLP